MRAATDAPSFGLGCAPLGGLFSPVEEEDAVATVRRAAERGAALLDVAPLYGVGLAEERLGAALRTLGDGGGGLGRPAVSTKVGRVLESGADPSTIFADGRDLHAVFDFSEAGVRRSLEASLERLGVDHVDVAFVHDPDDHMDAAIGTAVPALRRLQDEGVVGLVGAGMNAAEPLHRLVVEAGLDAVLLAGRWTLLDHQPAAARLLERCRSDGVRVILGGVLNSGLLAGGTTFDYENAPAALVAQRDQLHDVCGEHGVPLPVAALAFASAHPAVTTVLVGARSPAEVDAAVAGLSTDVPSELWDDLRRRGLLAEDVIQA